MLAKHLNKIPLLKTLSLYVSNIKCSNDVAKPTPIVKGLLGAVFAEEGKPFQVTLEGGKIYSWCPCGQSNKKPFCDGSHKEFNLTSEKKYKPIKLKVDKTGQYWLCNCRRSKNVPFCDGSHKKIIDNER